MTEPQTWTTIGVLAAALFGTITVVTSLLIRTVTGQIGSLRNNTRIDGLDRDIQSIAVRVFGSDQP